MKVHYDTLKRRVYRRDGQQYNPLDGSVDYGGAFLEKCKEVLEAAKKADEEGAEGRYVYARDMVEDVKRRCCKFMVVAIEELDKRIPTNWKIFENISSLKPSKMLSMGVRKPFSELPFQSFMGQKEKVEEQYRSIIHVNWKEEMFDGNNIPDDPVQFFGKIRLYEGMEGELLYAELADYVLNCHSLPLSNCYVERIFSMMGFIKTKWRNKTSLDMLDSLLRVKARFACRDIPCQEMKVTKKMLSLHNSTMYDFYSGPKAGHKRKLEEKENDSALPLKENEVDTEQEDFDFFAQNLPATF